MTSKVFQRLPLKTARASFFAILAFALVVAMLQASFELYNQNRALDQKIADIMQFGQTLVSQTTLQSEENAQQVIRTLGQYKLFSHIIIYRDQESLATLSVLSHSGESSWLGHLFNDKSVQVEHSFATNGLLQLQVDKATLLQPVYVRVSNTLILTILYALALAVVIYAVYYFLLIRPLLHLVERFTAFNQHKVATKKIDHLLHHENDELGFIINSANRLLGDFNKKHLELQQQQEQLSLILDASPNQVFAVDADGNLLFFNQAFKSYFSNVESTNYLSLLANAGIKEAEQISAIIKYICKDQLPSYGMRQSFSGMGDENHIMQMSLVPFMTDKLRYVIVVLNDISSLIKAEQRVEYLAYRDMLTGLPNRNKILEQLEEDIKSAEYSKQFGAIFLIDLKDFKRINDTMGHSFGDELLIDLSRRISSRVRAQETLARIGADVFILSIPNLADTVEEARECAISVTGWLLETISQPVTVRNQEFLLGATLGIALFPVGKVSVEILLSQADTALTEAKQQISQTYAFFEPEMAILASQLLQLENDVNQAYLQKDFLFHLQPLINMHDNSLAGAEALIRWNHPERGAVSAEDIIKSLERTDMINPVSFQLLDNVCAFICKHKDSGQYPEGLRISVNISERQLHDADFVGKSLAVLEKYELPGHCLEFEITERAALQNIDDVIEKMRKLQGSGITFALDDFGTGYSSLSYLKRLPVNKIKIDKSFIDDIAIDPQDAAMVSSIITIARNLNLTIVAEGVETKEQADWLKQHGDILIQGHLYDRSMTECAFAMKYLPEPSEPLQ